MPVCQYLTVLKSILLLFCLAAMVFGLNGCGGGLGSAAGALLGNPVILAISPNPAVRGQTITITGTNLNGTLTTAWFNGTSSNASSGGSSSVVVVVPTTISAGTYNVYVITTDGNGNYSTQSNAVTLSIQ
jgi:hypothetical protein